MADFVAVLARTGGRLRVQRFTARLRVLVLAAAAVMLAALVAERVLGLGLPLGAVALALAGAVLVLAPFALPRRDAAGAARALDRHAKTFDLFLTRALLPAEGAAGYEPLVVERADAAARTVDPRAAVPIDWRRPLAHVAGAAAVLALAWLALPDLRLLDASAQAERQVASERRRTLEDEKRAAERKIQALEERQVGATLRPPTAAALQQLQQELRRMRPDEQQPNRKRLEAQQQALGEQWRQAKAKAGDDAAKAQSLGRRSDRSRAIEQELRSGSAATMQQQLDAVRELQQQMAKADPGRRDELRRQIEQQLRELQDAASAMGQAGSELRSSLATALQQLASTSSPELAAPALAALEKSLELSALEAQALAQSLRDLQQLERALETARLAKLANDLAPLDGKACESCDALAEYEKLYREMLEHGLACEACQGSGKDGEGKCAACNGSGQKPCGSCNGAGCGSCNGTGLAAGGLLSRASGVGGGMGKAGIGRGGIAPEDDSQRTAFTPDKVASQLTAGRMLMQLRTTGEAEKGEAKQRVDEALRAVQQEAAEAVLRQDVPQGYHTAIKSYFEGMQKR